MNERPLETSICWNEIMSSRQQTIRFKPIKNEPNWSLQELTTNSSRSHEYTDDIHPIFKWNE